MESGPLTPTRGVEISVKAELLQLLRLVTA